MTCEISIMNRQAIALAADSATTVTEWVAGKEEQRFFKGANKIFQLSHHHPVGLMIFGTATLHEVPWELIVKEFRKYLGNKALNDLDGYAQELFDFIKDHSQLFPPDYQARIFREEARKYAGFYLFMADQHDSIKSAADGADKANAYKQYFTERMADVMRLSFEKPFDQGDLDTALAQYKTEMEGTVRDLLDNPQAPVDLGQVAELAITALLKMPTTVMSSTGVVIAGFGDQDYFPGYHEYECHGLLLGKFLWKTKESMHIGFDTPSHINAFAMTAMVRTFQFGFSRDVYGNVVAELRKALKTFSETIKAEIGVADIPNLDAHIENTVDTHTATWTRAAWSAHGWPLSRLIGSLPVDEMAELAETLIMLESLKEKVTKPTTSVGGPVDVAVITKGDGFIWIKRKHYFDPKLNPRFFRRQISEERMKGDPNA